MLSGRIFRDGGDPRKAGEGGGHVGPCCLSRSLKESSLRRHSVHERALLCARRVPAFDLREDIRHELVLLLRVAAGPHGRHRHMAWLRVRPAARLPQLLLPLLGRRPRPLPDRRPQLPQVLLLPRLLHRQPAGRRLPRAARGAQPCDCQQGAEGVRAVHAGGVDPRPPPLRDPALSPPLPRRRGLPRPPQLPLHQVLAAHVFPARPAGRLHRRCLPMARHPLQQPPHAAPTPQPRSDAASWPGRRLTTSTLRHRRSLCCPPAQHHPSVACPPLTSAPRSLQSWTLALHPGRRRRLCRVFVPVALYGGCWCRVQSHQLLAHSPPSSHVQLVLPPPRPPHPAPCACPPFFSAAAILRRTNMCVLTHKLAEPCTCVALVTASA
mmetsp:Transcript_2938/g.5197  ORF Transcript_2938/g.5197 Transcript_2938/m.5197 type:complete len:380 (-) Transcript_2938:360-1499(-)